MAFTQYKNVITALFGVCMSAMTVSASAAEANRFIETVAKKNDAGQIANVRQLCLKDQSLRLDNDVIAVINKVDGKVMADKGKGFVSSPVGTLLKEGNRVVALDQSVAEIVFFDCCRTALKSNNLITISANPGCKAAVVDAGATNVAAAAVHPASYIAPAAGAFILIQAISAQ